MECDQPKFKSIFPQVNVLLVIDIGACMNDGNQEVVEASRLRTKTLQTI